MKPNKTVGVVPMATRGGMLIDNNYVYIGLLDK
jgi:hypothetical protein